MSAIKDLGYARTIDTVGRVGVPKKIREEYDLPPNAEINWGVIKTEEGDFLGFLVGQSKSEQEERALYEDLKKKFETAR